MAEEYLHKDETYRIIGAAFEVYNDKGCGFLEHVYQECLEIEFGLQEIPCVVQQQRVLFYKGRQLESTFAPDFICFDNVIVEIKAVSQLVGKHRSQVINYLKVTEIQVALLINFGAHPKLEYERIVNTRDVS